MDTYQKNTIMVHYYGIIQLGRQTSVLILWYWAKALFQSAIFSKQLAS